MGRINTRYVLLLLLLPLIFYLCLSQVHTGVTLLARQLRENSEALLNGKHGLFESVFKIDVLATPIKFDDTMDAEDEAAVEFIKLQPDLASIHRLVWGGAGWCCVVHSDSVERANVDECAFD